MKNNLFKAHLALLGANLIYGVNFIIAKGIMPDKIGPSSFVFIRLLFATPLFWILKSFVIKERVAKSDMLRLMFCGLFGAAANQLLFFHGINLTSPIDASIIMTAVPVIVLVFSSFLLKERITKHKLLGITIGGVGAIALILYGNKASGTSSVLGNLFVFLNATSYSLYLVFVKPLMKKYKAITVVSWVFLFGFLFTFPVGIGDFLNTDFSGFTLNTYLVIGFVVLFTTFFAYLFNIYSLQYVTPSVTSSYIYLQPLISFVMVAVYANILSQTQYTQDINLVKIISCLLVVIGVYMVSKKPKTMS
ncbi:DMT family transporter [Yeosuana marina]|uniref:DMT family transporter n=1 Tax=Yeosuana marina TaxID=1565536 RepID=UPI00141E264D|nr:DMT family transporter [Yeosuana marina]